MMSSPVEIPANGLDLVPVLGPLYWGFLCSLVLTGINVLQGYIYFPSNDRLSLRIIAASMLILNVTSSALVAQSVFYYLVPHFGSLLPLNAITNELSAECLISTIITFISQTYFVVQLWGVAKARNNSYIVPILVGALSVAAAAGGIGCTTAMVIHKHSILGARSRTFSIFFGLAKGFGALTDIIATIAMCSMLVSARTAFDSTNSVIRSLMMFIMQRGILVTLIQTLLLITFHAAPDHLYWLAFHVNVTKLYANTFFAMLNGRERLNQQLSTTGKVPTYPSNISFGTSRDTKSKLSNPETRSHDDDLDMIELSMHTTPKKSKVPDMPLVTKTVIISDL
ncbi:hypothetical protein BDY19DRAFT_625793 [Irpex rosettiformis]|uniref:Uncharacterized protein n=1 Tax=Irpex rosettiformis TaxID=378272 RepID=A0ACB8UAR4_9APHY|nr:hypothetical protein BDY19DRAFT_625793 [Irpex rosettiformis]